jgi:hypothetical protein
MEKTDAGICNYEVASSDVNVLLSLINILKLITGFPPRGFKEISLLV